MKQEKLTYLVTASSVRASPVLWRPMTTHLFSVNAFFASLTTAGTFADIHMCRKKRCHFRTMKYENSIKKNLRNLKHLRTINNSKNKCESIHTYISMYVHVCIYTWWLAQYNRHNWGFGFSSGRHALAASNSTRNSAQNSAAFLYMSCNVKKIKSKLKLH